MNKSQFFHSSEIPPSELIVSEQGRIYHLDLKPSEIADDIIIVGDQERVAQVSKHFDKIEHKVSKREFITHTGIFKGKKIGIKDGFRAIWCIIKYNLFKD